MTQGKGMNHQNVKLLLEKLVRSPQIYFGKSAEFENDEKMANFRATV